MDNKDNTIKELYDAVIKEYGSIKEAHTRSMEMKSKGIRVTTLYDLLVSAIAERAEELKSTTSDE